MKRIRAFLCAALVLALALGLLAGCGDTGTAAGDAAGSKETPAAETQPAETAEDTEDSAGPAAEKAEETEETEKADTWAVYLYVCGSDLESENALATENLLALMKADRTDDTIFVAQTGGASVWQNNFVDADKLQRWFYVDGDMELVDEQESASMGDPQTLADFLQFCTTEYPADHTMLVIWDHGGGTLHGCCCDEIYDDSLTLTEMHQAFDSVWDLSTEYPPIDILGFDCCLMATIDVADLFSDTAAWLIASEEIEPGLGWDYAALGETLAADPHISASDLGISVCDSYYRNLEANDQADTATLSLTDLSKMPALTMAFDAFVDEMIVDAYEDTTLFKEYAIDAGLTENYGGNSRAEGYYDLVDIRGFAVNASGRISCAQALVDAVDDAVVYRVNGEYRPDGGGLSFYFDFDGYDEKNYLYNDEGTIEALKVLYTFGIADTLTDDQTAYMEDLGLDTSALPEILTFEDYDFGEVPIQISEDGTAYAVFGSQAYGCIADAMYEIFALIDGEIYLIGTDDEVYADYTTGLVADQSMNNWGYLDGNLCYMELSYDSDDYNLYSVPVLIDGEKMFLEIAYDYGTGEWEILGARADGGSTAMTSRLEYPEEGTEMTLLLSLLNDDNELEDVEGATFTFTGDDSFEYLPLPDGSYATEFAIVDLYTNYAWSEAIWFDLADGVRTYEAED